MYYIKIQHLLIHSKFTAGVIHWDSRYTVEMKCQFDSSVLSISFQLPTTLDLTTSCHRQETSYFYQYRLYLRPVGVQRVVTHEQIYNPFKCYKTLLSSDTYYTYGVRKSVTYSVNLVSINLEHIHTVKSYPCAFCGITSFDFDISNKPTSMHFKVLYTVAAMFYIPESNFYRTSAFYPESYIIHFAKC